MLRSGLALAFLAAMASASTSCLTPTLPIPPPIVEDLQAPLTDGTVAVHVLAANAEPDAQYLLVLNQRTGEIRGMRPLLAPTAPPLPAADTGDFLVLIPARTDDCLLAYWMYQVYDVGQDTGCLLVP